jgi:dipeptidase D
VDHDFYTDPIIPLIEGDWIRSSKGTTLGADNGAGVALMMALLDAGNISHPPIEAIFTSEEERGMVGARAFDVSLLNGRRFINLDSEGEGIITVSSAAGAHLDIVIPVDTIPMPGGLITNRLWIHGLLGGHSGVDIDKGLANANVLIGRLLDTLKNSGYEFYISSINGGTQRNAIPMECEIIISFAEADSQAINALVLQIATTFRSDYPVDGNITIGMERVNPPRSIMTNSSLQRIVDGILSAPNGVLYMSPNIEGLVQTSSNLGVITTSNGTVTLLVFPRSSAPAEQRETLDRFIAVSQSIGAEMLIRNESPAWPFRVNSLLQAQAAAVFKSMYGREVSFEAVHAGLECGIFAEKIPDADIISIGPDIRGAHTPDESLSISSFKRFAEFVVRILESI